MNRLLLIDGNAIMHRAYHAMPPLTDPQGNPVQVLYGFASMLLKLYDNLKPTHMAVAFDRPGPTFRNELFDGYQAKRPKADDEFISQISGVHELSSVFGLPSYEADGYEADDVIGTIAAQTKGKHIDQVIIVTGDRDILQLVEDERVLVFMPTKGLSEGRMYGEKEVLERMGVGPSQIVDLKALMGDSSDNYSGVAGIGPKTAIALLNQYTTLETLYAAVHAKTGTPPEIRKQVAEKLITGESQAVLSKQLAAIRNDAPITFEEEKAVVPTLNTQSSRARLESLHFFSLLKRLTSDDGNVLSSAVKPERKTKDAASEQQQLF